MVPYCKLFFIFEYNPIVFALSLGSSNQRRTPGVRCAFLPRAGRTPWISAQTLSERWMNEICREFCRQRRISWKKMNNVNTGLINHGLLTRGTPPIVKICYFFMVPSLFFTAGLGVDINPGLKLLW